MNGFSPASERELLALLADRALFGLGPAAHRRLSRHLAERPESDAEIMDRTAALLLLGARMPSEPLPEAISREIRAAAERFLAQRAAGGEPTPDFQDGYPP